MGWIFLFLEFHALVNPLKPATTIECIAESFGFVEGDISIGSLRNLDTRCIRVEVLAWLIGDDMRVS